MGSLLVTNIDQTEFIKLSLKQTPRLVAYLFNRPGINLKVNIASDNGRSYFIPSEFDKSTNSSYKHTMDWIERYRLTVFKNKKLSPKSGVIATSADLVDIQIEAEIKALYLVAASLSEINGTYFTNLAKSLVEAIGSKLPKPIKRKVEALIDQSIPAERNLATLVGHYPLNQFDLLSQGLFGLVEQTTEGLGLAVDKLGYKHKAKFLKHLLETGQIDTKARYSFELIAEPGQFASLSQFVGCLETQALSPYFGYDIDQFELDDTASGMFERCFDMSYKLYGELQSAGFSDLAQLAVLNGFRQRIRADINLGQLKQLSQEEVLSPIYEAILTQVEQKHSLIAQSLPGVDSTEENKI